MGLPNFQEVPQHGILLTLFSSLLKILGCQEQAAFPTQLHYSNSRATVTPAALPILLENFVCVHVFYSIFPSGDFCFLLNGAV